MTGFGRLHPPRYGVTKLPLAQAECFRLAACGEGRERVQSAKSAHSRKARNVLHSGRGWRLFRTKTVPNAAHNPGSLHVRAFSLTSLSDVISSFVPRRSYYGHEDSAALASSAIACLAERSFSSPMRLASSALARFHTGNASTMSRRPDVVSASRFPARPRPPVARTKSRLSRF
jgi:hypothetical protein